MTTLGEYESAFQKLTSLQVKWIKEFGKRIPGQGFRPYEDIGQAMGIPDRALAKSRAAYFRTEIMKKLGLPEMKDKDPKDVLDEYMEEWHNLQLTQVGSQKQQEQPPTQQPNGRRARLIGLKNAKIQQAQQQRKRHNRLIIAIADRRIEKLQQDLADMTAAGQQKEIDYATKEKELEELQTLYQRRSAYLSLLLNQIETLEQDLETERSARTALEAEIGKNTEQTHQRTGETHQATSLGAVKSPSPVVDEPLWWTWVVSPAIGIALLAFVGWWYWPRTNEGQVQNITPTATSQPSATRTVVPGTSAPAVIPTAVPTQVAPTAIATPQLTATTVPSPTVVVTPLPLTPSNSILEVGKPFVGPTVALTLERVKDNHTEFVIENLSDTTIPTYILNYHDQMYLSFEHGKYYLAGNQLVIKEWVPHQRVRFSVDFYTDGCVGCTNGDFAYDSAKSNSSYYIIGAKDIATGINLARWTVPLPHP